MPITVSQNGHLNCEITLPLTADNLNPPKMGSQSGQTVGSGEGVRPARRACVRGVDLAVRRRIKWLIGGARRGEGVKPSGQPSLFSSWVGLPRSASAGEEEDGGEEEEKKTIGAEQTNHMAIKHDSPLLHWDFIQTAFYCSLPVPTSKTHTHTQARALTCTPPSLPINMTVVLQVPTV